MMNEENFGKRLKRFRKTLGVPISVIAKACGVSSRTIFNWEAGVYPPGYDDVKKIASALGVAVIELIAEEGESFQSVATRVPELLTAEDRELLTVFRDNLDAAKAAALASPLVAESHRRMQERETKIAPGRESADDGLESSRQWLQPGAALVLMRWVDQQMKDLPSEGETWQLLDTLSHELARQSGLEDRPQRQAAPEQREDSDVTNAHGGKVALRPIGKQ